MTLLIRLAPYALGAFLLVVIWLHGNETGRKICKAQHQEAVVLAQKEAIEAAELASRKEVERLAEAAKAAELAQALEDAAHADPETLGCGLPAERVRRLNRY